MVNIATPGAREEQSHPLDDQLRDALPHRDAKVDVAEVEQEHAQRSPVIGIDDPSTDIDAVFARQAATGRHAAVGAGGNGDADICGDKGLASRGDGGLLCGVQVVAGGKGRAAGRGFGGSGEQLDLHSWWRGGEVKGSSRKSHGIPGIVKRCSFRSGSGWIVEDCCEVDVVNDLLPLLLLGTLHATARLCTGSVYLVRFGRGEAGRLGMSCTTSGCGVASSAMADVELKKRVNANARRRVAAQLWDGPKRQSAALSAGYKPEVYPRGPGTISSSSSSMQIPNSKRS